MLGSSPFQASAVGKERHVMLLLGFLREGWLWWEPMVGAAPAQWGPSDLLTLLLPTGPFPGLV